MDNIAEFLSWYVLAGVESIDAEEPFNFIVKKTGQTEMPEPPQTNAVKAEPARAEFVKAEPLRPATTLLAQENNEACLNAREKCRQASDLSELKNIVEQFEGCSLKFSANSTVFGDGNPQAKIMLIGEAPGADEDRSGKPFVGRSGQLLEKMLNAIKVQRQDCFITNVLPWRPPGNRTPTAEEVAVCLPFLKRQIELVEPKIIFLLGASAANAVLGNSDSISAMRGKMLEVQLENGKVFQALASFHPAYLLRSSAQKAKSWNDLLRLKRFLQDEPKN